VWLLIGIALISTPLAPAGWNDTSRLATIQSLVEHGTLAIDDSAFVGTGDKVRINGHFYSDKLPMAAVLGATAYWPLYHAGIDLHLGRSAAHYLIVLFTAKLFWLAGVLAFWCALSFTKINQRGRVLATAVLAVGSLYFTWSSTLNNHIIAGGALSIGFYYLLRARYADESRVGLTGAGFFFSLAAAVDAPTGIFYVLFLCLLLSDRQLRRAAGWYLLPLAVTIVPTMAMNYAMHGRVTPVNVVRAYFEYPGSPWVGAGGLSGTATNSASFTIAYATMMLVGPRGFLIYNPFLLIALPALAGAIRRRTMFANEALAIALGSAAVVAYYAATSDNYAGWAYSIRWFVPLWPLLLFFLSAPFHALTRSGERAVFALLAVSVAIAAVGALNPWSDPSYGVTPFLANLHELFARLGRVAGPG
jgi:hypothetical protein